MASETSTVFKISEKPPEKYLAFGSEISLNHKDHKKHVKSLSHYKRNKCTKVIPMSNFSGKLHFSDNGFVNTIIEAYNCHHNLILRPDDVWAAIMTQFSFYINKNAEEFRGKFVNFEGKKTLTVYGGGTLKTARYDFLVKQMTEQIDKNLVDSEVKEWILPNFSTTADNDLVTIGVVFMATMKKYFDYKICLLCGIPSVTLEGTVEDWENVYGRLNKLKEYKLDRWYDMLEPVLKQFVQAKKGEVDVKFWEKVCLHSGGGSGPSYISGWITTFCAFDKDGNWNGQPFGDWLKIDTNDIPTGIVEVNVEVDDNGSRENCVMFAGHLAAELKDEETTLQPTLGWVIAHKPESTGDDGNFCDKSDLGHSGNK